MNRPPIAALLAALPLIASAAPGDATDQYFNRSAPRLSAQEKSAVASARKAQATTVRHPVAATGGMVRYVVGVQQIHVVCAVLQVCDIELQAGEQVRNLHVGDPRFSIELATSGAGAAEVQHIIVKPHDTGLSSSLIVSTDRRTYHVSLRSHRTDYMPRVGFIYPDEVQSRELAIRQRTAQRTADDTLPHTGENINSLQFDYALSGSAPWKPVRVYNDGTRTVIQMPSTMKQTEAPVLLVLRRNGRPFQADENIQVNYRIHDDRYIVDTVFDKAVLIAGAGSNQDRITITRGH